MDSGRFFEDKIISNAVVTDQIFRHLTKSDLFECSLISKKCTPPSRQFLRSHYKCLLRLDANGRETALDALKLLDDSIEILYNGISWDLFSIQRFCCSSNYLTHKQLSNAFNVYRKILRRLPKIKYLKLDNFPNDPIPVRKHCQIDLHDIEKLKLFGYVRTSVWDSFFGQGEFSSLKALDIRARFYPSKNFDNDLPQKVFSSCPVLQKWSSKIGQTHIKDFAQANKLALIKALLIQTRIPSDVVDTIEAGNVSLKRLYFFLDPTAANVEIFRRITCESTASLPEIKIRHKFCKLLVTTAGIRPFINVKKLCIQGSVGIFEDMRDEIEENSNVQRLFPNANVVF